MTDHPARPGPAIVVAVGRDGAIGQRGGLPWRAPEDLAHFRALTMGHDVIIGATTWQSIGRPLPGRRLVVVSRRALDLPPDVRLASSPQAGMALALAGDPAPLVAGGRAIYEALLPAVVRIYRTDVAVDAPEADVHMPALDPAAWLEVACWPGEDSRLTFRVLDRLR